MADSDGFSDDERFLNCFTQKPVVLPKSRVLQAIDSILLQPETKPVDEKAQYSAMIARKDSNRCMDKSHFPIFDVHLMNRKQGREKNLNSLLPIISEMRHCLLAGDWNGYKELLLILFKSYLTHGKTLFCVRSCFVLLLNHPNRTAEMLDDFIAGCLKINEEPKRIQYLHDCFTLKTSSACTSTSNDRNDNIENDYEDEEIFFDSDFSSD